TTGPVTFKVTPPPPPTLTSVSPSSAYRGTTVTVTLNGTNLSGVSIAAGNGVNCNPNTGGTATSLTASCTVSNLAPTGAHNVTVTNAGGTSNAVTLTVVAPPSLSGTTNPIFPVFVARNST